MNLLIRNARVLDPTQDLDGQLDLLIEDGLVTAVKGGAGARKGVEEIDAAGLVAVPGFIDLHTHLREPGQEHKETIRSGTAAAVAGGFTAVCAMANTHPPNDERAVTEMILAEAARTGACRVYPIGAVTRKLAGEELAEMADLRAAGCVAVSDDGQPVMNAKVMRRALEYTRMLGIPVVAHEQDLGLSDGGVMHEGFYSTLLGLKGAPAAAEEVMTSRDILLAELTGGHLHVAHVSTRGALDAIRRGKAAGVQVTCEVTPHHLTLTDETLRSFSTNLKMNPPLRSGDHREALLNAISDGTIDAIATDHAPHHVDEKDVEFDLAPFGITGLETAFSVAHHELVVREGAIGLRALVELFSCRPSAVFKLPGGTLREGAPGDVTLIDPDADRSYGAFLSKASNSPWLGATFRGAVVGTVVGGLLRYELPGRPLRAAEPARPATGKSGKRR